MTTRPAADSSVASLISDMKGIHCDEIANIGSFATVASSPEIRILVGEASIGAVLLCGGEAEPYKPCLFQGRADRTFRVELRTETLAERVEREVSFAMSKLDVVERVYTRAEDEVFHTWVVVAERDPEALNGIYDAERKLVGRYHGLELALDFSVLYRSGRPIESLISGARLSWSR